MPHVSRQTTIVNALQALRPLGVTVLGVPSDEHGPRPDVLRALLAGARPPIRPQSTHSHVHTFLRCACVIDTLSLRLLPGRVAAGLPLPKLFYGIPVSCNPTGVSWSEARKRAVYAAACEFDFLILEDDAYFYLQFPAAPGAPPPGLRGLGRSLLSMDTAGRVIRADTFSKFLAPVRLRPMRQAGPAF
jgi:DNA-binding transcriptional MocR family regulator